MGEGFVASGNVLAGPQVVDAMFEALKTAGLPVPHIRREKYVSSK